jgi:hypothetical protein
MSAVVIYVFYDDHTTNIDRWDQWIIVNVTQLDTLNGPIDLRFPIHF